jgi:hypothetical protein
MGADDSGDGRSIDLSLFKLEAHVEDALRIAFLLSENHPLTAGDVLTSALGESRQTRSSGSRAFSRWASFFPDEIDVSIPKAVSILQMSSVPMNSFLAASFEAAEIFFGKNKELWGRDYITLALLAVDDPSLDRIAAETRRTIQSLRDEWFLFVSSDSPYADHRPWDKWWKQRSVRLPGRSGTYLLTWDPERTSFDNLAAAIAEIEGKGEVTIGWSVGNHGIRRGDRVFFMRHGENMPGLIGSGYIASEITKGRHWDQTKPADWTAYYAEVRWEVLRRQPLIPLAELAKQTGEQKLWIETGSGLSIPQELAQNLEILWKEALLAEEQRGRSPSTLAGTGALSASLVAGSQSPGVAPRQQQQTATSESEGKQSKPTVAPEPATRLPDVWMLSDRPLENRFAEQDRFQFKDYASALAAVLDHEKTETPFTMAINAPWGAGKTTLANMIAEQLLQRPKDRGHAPHIICWFNAWMHDDAPNLATAFISEVGRTANRSRDYFRRIVNPLPAALLEPSSRKWRGVTLGAPIVIATLFMFLWAGSHLKHLDQQKKDEAKQAYQMTNATTKDASERIISTSETKTQSKSDHTPPSSGDKVDSFLENFQSSVVVLGAFLTGLAVIGGLLAKIFTSTPLGGYVQSPDKAAEAGAIQSAEKQLKKLIAQARWRGNRFIVFVDDIERCKPPRSVDVLDAVNQLMNHQGVVVVLLGDMSAVAAAAQLKYKDLAEIFVPSAGIALTGADRGKEAFGRLYLQKIIQFQFDLPIPPTGKIRQYLKQLAAAPQAEGGGVGQP